MSTLTPDHPSEALLTALGRPMTPEDGARAEAIEDRAARKAALREKLAKGLGFAFYDATDLGGDEHSSVFDMINGQSGMPIENSRELQAAADNFASMKRALPDRAPDGSLSLLAACEQFYLLAAERAREFERAQGWH